MTFGCLQSRSVHCRSFLTLDVLPLHGAMQGCSLLVIGMLEASQEMQLQWALYTVTHIPSSALSDPQILVGNTQVALEPVDAWRDFPLRKKNVPCLVLLVGV